MSGPRKTCDKCQHFTPSDTYSNLGNCAKAEYVGDASLDFKTGRKGEDDKLYAWDAEGYQAGAYVGVKFGCIHWERKA